MANTIRRYGLIGGTAGSLDSVDGTALASGDVALSADSSGNMYAHYLDPSSGAAENSPLVVTPNTNAGNKRWRLSAWWAALYNGLSLVANAVGFTLSGGTTSKSFTVEDTSLVNQDLTSDAGPTFAHTHLTDAVADNLATNQSATTQSAKAEDAVLRRPPEQMVWITAGATETLKVAHSAVFDITTNSFLVGGKFLLDDWKVATTLLQKMTGGVGFQLEVLVTTGYLKLTLNALTFTTATAPTLVNGTAHKIIADVSIGATQTTVYWVIDGVLFETSAPQNNTTSLANSNPLYILGTSTARHAGGVGCVYLGNRSYTSNDVLLLYRNGVAFADRWGSQTAIYSSDFSAGVDGFGTSTGAVVGNINSIGGGDNWLRFTCNASSSQHSISKSGVFTVGKKYSVVLTYDIPSTNSNINNIYFYQPSGGAGTVCSTLDAATSVTIPIFTATSTNLYLYVNSTTTFQDAGGDDVFYVKNIVVTEVGMTIALEPEGIQPAPGQWLDSSSNKLHALQPASGSSLTRGKDTFEIKWANTWAGTHEAQAVSGVSQNVFPPGNIRIESITMRCTATGVNVILGDGSDTDHFVASVALATYLDCTIANRSHDGTNMKCIIDPDGNYTGSITTTIKGIILE